MVHHTVLTLAALLASQSLLANNASTRIVGGKNADAEWNTVVALVSKTGKENAVQASDPLPVYRAQFCGGTLLSGDWVLTAAHCVEGLLSSSIEIMVGSQSLDISPNSSLLKDVQSIHIHPSYDTFTDRNDIALLRLAEPADPSLPNVSTAVLSLESTDQILEALSSYDDVMTALGWGVEAYESPDRNTPYYPIALQEVSLDYVTNTTCQSRYNTNANGETIYSSMICANEIEPGDEGDIFGEDSCQGDSGGPLFITSATLNDSPQAGVTSFGYQCGDYNIPGVYSRVSLFLGWIEQTTNISGIALRNLAIGENTLQNQGVNSFPLHIPVKNAGTGNATHFAVSIEHSADLILTPTPAETGLNCTSPSSTQTKCDYTGSAVGGGSTRELIFNANDSSARTAGSETLSVTVTLDEYRDYHRLDDSGTVPVYFGEPVLGIAAEPFCLNPSGSSVQMRIEATLTNSSPQIHSEGTRVTGTLPEGLALFGRASPNCSLENDLFTCTVGQLDAEKTLTATFAVTAAPETLETVNLEIDNENGAAIPGSTLSTSVELDFSREDLPTCPAIPTPVSNLTGGSSGGGGTLSLALLWMLALLGLRHKR